MGPRTFGVVADFPTPEALLEAVREMRRRGFGKLDALTPFPIHGMDDALGEKPSRLGFLVFAGGLAGCAAGLLLQWWTGAVDYPLNIGGKPLFAVEFSIPITFELTALFAAFVAVFGMFALNGLPRLYHPVFNYSRIQGATDDRFLLVVEGGDVKKAEAALTEIGAEHVEVVDE